MQNGNEKAYYASTNKYSKIYAQRSCLILPYLTFIAQLIYFDLFLLYRSDNLSRSSSTKTLEGLTYGIACFTFWSDIIRSLKMLAVKKNTTAITLVNRL